ncbi:MAG: hypothetical protein COA53_06505 [Rhodobacteraceae bacterium]|nr:MAG: hypothetical protein COA53_06505 [Paracoccaceae bacterium]
MIITPAYAPRSANQPKITVGAERAFGALLLLLESKHHVAKLPPGDDSRSGYLSGSVRARTLAMFKGDIQIASSDIAAHLGISTHYAGLLLLQLRSDGYIRVNGTKRNRMGPPVNVYTIAVAA